MVELKRAVLERVHELVELDSDLAVNLIMVHFRWQSDEVVHGLGKFPKLQLAFLHQLNDRANGNVPNESNALQLEAE